MGSVTDQLSIRLALSTELRLKWCRQAAEALVVLHLKGIIHCNLHTNNLLLDDNLNALLSDFQGTFKDFDGYAMESAQYFLPQDATCPPNEATDIFALGTLVYTIMVGTEPYTELLDTEVEERYMRHEFPNTGGFVCGETILRCWNKEYTDATEVLHNLECLGQP